MGISSAPKKERGTVTDKIIHKAGKPGLSPVTLPVKQKTKTNKTLDLYELGCLEFSLDVHSKRIPTAFAPGAHLQFDAI